MRLLVDSDAFCKLAASGLLSDAAALFHAELGPVRSTARASAYAAAWTPAPEIRRNRL